MLIDCRFGELISPTELVRPESAQVFELANGLAVPVGQDRTFALWDWVCRNIKYPLTSYGQPTDLHTLQAFEQYDMPFFGIKYQVNKSTYDFWQYPAETLAWRIGDCDCEAILLASLLLNVRQDVAVVIGTYKGYGHAWVEAGNKILEATLTKAPVDGLKDISGYSAQWKFNNTAVYGNPTFSMKYGEKNKLAMLQIQHNCAVKGV
jgi:hypothetical protein